MSFPQFIPGPVLCSHWLEREQDLVSARPQVSWGCWRTSDELSKGMPGGEHTAIFPGQSPEVGGKLRGFQFKLLFSISKWPQLSPEKHKGLGPLWHEKSWLLHSTPETLLSAIIKEEWAEVQSGYAWLEVEQDWFKIKLSSHEQLYSPSGIKANPL